MPVRNAAPYVEQAVVSVLTQSFADLELVVVDDGSTDGSPDIVAGISDTRIRLLRQRSSRGISCALNAGIAASTGDLVARMDADDVSLRERLARQVDFLEQHQEVGVVGCPPMLIDVKGRPLREHTLLTHDRELRRMLVLQGPFCHGAVMFRRDVFERAGGYRTEEEPAEDYALWVRMAAITSLANISTSLYQLRISSDSVSAQNAARQRASRDAIRARARVSVGDPSLRWRELRSRRREYAAVPGAEGRRLAARYASQHQELACLDVLNRGARAWRNVAYAVALGPVSPRTLVGMARFLRSERSVGE